MNTIRYFLAENGEAVGPFTVGQLRVMFAAGRVHAGSQVCREGGETWELASRLALDGAQVAGPVRVLPRGRGFWITAAMVCGSGLVAVVLISLVLLYEFGSPLGRAAQEAEDQRAAADITILTTALGMYKVQAGSFPTTEQGLEALVRRPTGPDAPQRWREVLDELPLDPWGRSYQYRCPGRDNLRRYDISSAGRDGLPDTADDIGN